MKKKNHILWLALVLLALPAVKASATSPQRIFFEGVLNDSLGAAMPNGTYSITFAFFDAQAGGTKLWEETQQVVVDGGEFTAVLGSNNPIKIGFETSHWLQVAVAGDKEPQERTEFLLPNASTDAH